MAVRGDGLIVREHFGRPRDETAGNVWSDDIADGLQNFLAGQGDFDRSDGTEEDHVQAIR